MFLEILWLRLVLDQINLVQIHGDPQIGDGLLCETTFAQFDLPLVHIE